jgi:thiol-disulfide isomerase/thioredoxin
MKNIMVALLLSLFISNSSSGQVTTTNADYKLIPDSAETVLKGYITRNLLESDTAFKWFAKNLKYGTPDEAAVESFRKNGQNFSVLVFGGTWCHDTQNLLPVFYQLVDKSGYPQNKITLVAVDREKTAPDELHKKYNIINVPTFIVLKDGKEVGRVVEYGKEGKIDKELGEIVSSRTLRP